MSEPAPFLAVEEPQQLKAFTDSLRTRLLVILGEKSATNQQLADEIGEAQAKVLYHLRILLDAGLIRLVDTQIKGGNVEKYYRAVARTFDLRLTPELRPDFYQSQLAVLGQELAASARTWAEQPPFYTARGRKITPQQAEKFFGELRNFIDTYWTDPHNQSAEPENSDAAATTYYCAALVFRSSRPNETSDE
jgi:DNA-binding transcriptional ArsR family regulator